MKHGFNDVINLVNKYIILATPLILFSLVSSVYMAASATGKIINMIFALLLLLLMTSAFIAGWFNMVKLSVSAPNRDDEPNSLIKEFVPGVGEYILSSLGAVFNVIAITYIIIQLLFVLGMKFIGDPGISPEALSKAMETATALKAFMDSLSAEQYVKLSQWNLLLMLGLSSTSFLFIFYLPALFFKSKNPFKALWLSLKDLFSRYILKTLGIYILILLGNAVISVMSVIFIGNVIIHFAVTLLNFYFILLICVGVFYYYYKHFVEVLLGQNIDTRV